MVAVPTNGEEDASNSSTRQPAGYLKESRPSGNVYVASPAGAGADDAGADDVGRSPAVVGLAVLLGTGVALTDAGAVAPAAGVPAASDETFAMQPVRVRAARVARAAKVRAR
jgi:hypothetical protein